MYFSFHVSDISWSCTTLLQNLEISEDFKLQGGTELGCMSTSTSNLQGDRRWLSVYPAEKEILSTRRSHTWSTRAPRRY
jgi:hypothetical protein